MSKENTAWFKEAKYGVFLHYLAATHYQIMKGKKLPDAAEWNRRVEAVDVEALARSIADTGAGYALITVGQSIPHHCSPNAVYQGLTGRTEKYCSERDLIADLAAAMEKQGIRLMVYYHGIPPSHDPDTVKAMNAEVFLEAHKKWMEYVLKREDPTKDPIVSTVAEKLGEFRKIHLDIMREWSDRWGKSVHGWWIDGCSPAYRLWDLEDELNYSDFAAALKSGNKESIVAFNPQVFDELKPRTEYEDYIAGEFNWDFPVDSEMFPITAKAAGKQTHITTFLGRHWRIGPSRFSDDFVAGYTKHLSDSGTVITWDVPIGDDGRIPEEFLRKLSAAGRAAGKL